MSDPMILRGLDAANPLAFLAALGTLRSLTLAWPEANLRLYWSPLEGSLRPHLTAQEGLSEDAVISTLLDQLRVLAPNPALAFADDSTVPRAVFRLAAQQAHDQATATDRSTADYIAALACDVLEDAKTGIVQDTAWRTMSGAGHQHLLKFMRGLATETTAEHLRAALLVPWRYGDPPPSLRWDPSDDRRYALRWDEPSGDPIRTVRGANALAAQAIPLFPLHPRGGVAATTGFNRVARKGTFFTWPIWACPVPLDVVRSLLALEELQSRNPPRPWLAARGVIEVFRSQRITQGKYRNFTMGAPV